MHPVGAQEDLVTIAERESVVRVYRYGVLAPTHNADVVRAQMRAGHQYKNRLIEIENGRRDAQRVLEVDSGLRAVLDDAVATEDAVAAVLRRISEHRDAYRTRATPVALSLELSAAKEAAKGARLRLSQKRAELRADVALADRRAEIDETALNLRKNARAHCGVYWGTYLLAESAVDASVKSVPLWEGPQANNLRFARWEGEGAVGVQIQGGVDPEDLDGNTQIRIVNAAVPHGPKADPNSRRSRERNRRVVLHLRVGSDAQRRPVWAEFPMLMHRPIPPGSRLKGAVVYLRMIGPREEWSVCLTLEIPAPAPSPGRGIVALHLGWRVLPDAGAMRVATCLAEGSEEVQEFRLLQRELDRMERPDHLRSTRDENFNRARAGFVWLLKRDGEAVPANVRHMGKTAHTWRSARRLALVVREWAKNQGVRVTHEDYLAWTEPGAEAWTLRDLELWRYHEHHLWEWETSLREKVLRWRREQYRVFAAGLARRFSTLLIEDFDISQVAHVPERGTAASEKDIPAARANRVRVAPAELRGCVLQAFAAAGGRVITVPPQMAPCSNCLQLDVWDRAANVSHVCTKCGQVWDQDHNAVRNILAAGWEKASESADVVSASPSKKGSRWSRAKEAKAAKAAAV